MFTGKESLSQVDVPSTGKRESGILVDEGADFPHSEGADSTPDSRAKGYGRSRIYEIYHILVYFEPLAQPGRCRCTLPSDKKNVFSYKFLSLILVLLMPEAIEFVNLCQVS